MYLQYETLNTPPPKPKKPTPIGQTIISEVLKVDNDYRIETHYPYNIYKVKKNGRFGDYIKESERNPGSYPRIVLNGKDYNKHTVIAEQFIPKPEGIVEVDHIDQDKSNYHVDNLRWVSHKVNCKNKKSYGKVNYDYVDELPENAIPLLTHKQNHFRDYYITPELDVYYFMGLRYRKLHRLYRAGRGDHYDIRDVNNKIKQISINSLSKNSPHR